MLPVKFRVFVRYLKFITFITGIIFSKRNRDCLASRVFSKERIHSVAALSDEPGRSSRPTNCDASLSCLASLLYEPNAGKGAPLD